MHTGAGIAAFPTSEIFASHPGLAARLRGVRHVALDMDGTIYRGGQLFEFTNRFLDQLTEWDIGWTFLTNNSSKSTEEYQAHLRKLGVRAGEGRVFISTHATIEYLRQRHPEVRRLYVLGSPGMRTELALAGFEITGESAEDEPEAVIVGFDPAMTYASLCRAAWWIRKGKWFVASHPDTVCPTDGPTVLVDCGAICAALTAATGRSPDAVAGKPHPRMLEGLMQRLGLNPERMAMAGDRLNTDIEMARRAGALGVLVLTGEDTVEEAAQAQPPPDLVVPDLAAFG
ncbi:MAG: HAD-IIA family hydrolase, partial [Verrucomicrobiaceae bacterium]